MPPFPEFAGPVLFHEDFDWAWSFGLTNDEVVIANYGTLRESWTGMALQRSGLVTPFIVPALSPTGHTNVASLTASAVRFWLTPYWASPAAGGTGPGKEATLVELVAIDGQEAATIWSLRTTADGSALMLLARSDAGPIELLRADIGWTPSAHCIALNFGPDGTALFVDGALAAKGPGTWPVPPKVAGLVFGSTWSGDASAEGDLDEIYGFACPLGEAAMAWHYVTHAGQAALGPVSDPEWQAQRDLAAKRRAERAAALASTGGGGAQTMRLLGPTSTCDTNSPVRLTNIVCLFTNGGWTTTLEIQGGIPGLLYDIFTTTNLSGDSITNSQWTWLERGPSCSTYQYTNQPDTFAFYVLGTPQDTDNDGLSDAYERHVLGTSPTTTNSPRKIYEDVLSSQNPSNWFKLDDGSLTNAIPGQLVTALSSTATWDVDAFATGSNSIQFNGTSQRMTAAGDVISGGSGNDKGSMSLLFRTMTGIPTTLLSTQRYVFCQKGSANNEFGLFFETNSPAIDPGSLKVRIGSQTNSVLASNAIIFGAWYYLAMTWNESSNRMTWYLAPIGGTFSSNNINFGAGNVVGNSSNVFFGNRPTDTNNNTFANAFRTPGSGALDQIAFWNRKLTTNEINAQFNTLNAMFRRPTTAFDLTHRNILLPVDNTNGLNANNAALEINTGWLNSGFKYLDPADWTQKYFYLSTTNTMVFEAPWNGARSSGGSGARSELRGTNPDGSEDNWTPLGTNTLEATCAVVSAGATGTNKLIIGQIYCESASTPTFAVNYNHPNLKEVSVTYKFSPNTGSADDNLILATNMNLLDLIHYKVQLIDDGTMVKIRGKVFGPNTTGQQEWTLTSEATNAWHSATFYFKAGCYYTKPTSGTGKVTFSSLSATQE